MWEQIEALENHAGLPPLARDLGRVQRIEEISHPSVSQEFAIEPKCSTVDPFQLITNRSLI